MQRRLVFITGLLVALFSTSCALKKSGYDLRSPDGQVRVTFRVTENGEAFYNVMSGNSVIIRDSRLGLVREDGDFSTGLSVTSVSDSEPVEETYDLVAGKKRHCVYQANRRVLSLTNASGKKMDVVFQVSDDGAAFRYVFPDSSAEVKKIVREVSTFDFPTGTKAFIQQMSAAKSGWCQVNPSYEEYYEPGTPVESLRFHEPGWVFPALFQTGKSWMLISETAPDRNYCGCRLQQDTTNHVFFVQFPPPVEVYPGRPLGPESVLPWKSPWRIIVVGKGLKSIVESTLGTDLAEPSKLQDVSFVQPGRSSWSWVLLKDDSTVYDVQKRFVDYASAMTWEYCLVDADWDRKIGYDKIAQLAAYAESKHVGILAWYNSSGDWNTTVYSPKSKLLTHEDRVQEFSKLRDMGIKGVKVDFWGGDGQSMMVYYQDMFEDAAAFGLMVNCHGATLPRGWQRTYPNLITTEAVRGYEYLTFDQPNTDLEAVHSCFQPFTRNAFDPMDFTPVAFSEIPGKHRVTTQGFEIATSVIFWSGVQHFAETPKGMARVPDFVRDFMKQVPVVWDETRFIDGYPGKLAVLARRSGDTWYVAGINGEDVPQKLALELSFIPKKTGTLITDGEDSRSFSTGEISISPKGTLDLPLQGKGGFVMVF